MCEDSAKTKPKTSVLVNREHFTFLLLFRSGTELCLTQDLTVQTTDCKFFETTSIVTRDLELVFKIFLSFPVSERKVLPKAVDE